jgi:BlaI family penicillinase repressor
MRVLLDTTTFIVHRQAFILAQPIVPRQLPLPTTAELAILKVLWSRGRSSVRDVHDAIGNGTTYTTSLKLLQMMLAKGLVRRDDDQRQHIYEAVVDERSTLGRLVDHFVDQVFEGSAGAMALRALGSGSASREELAHLKRMIKDLERRSQT